MLTVILRLVFLFYAEERDMLPEDETFLRYYSLAGLYDRLREDAALYPDTRDQRYGAWAQLVVLFRLVHDGAECGRVRLPRRHGVLFDPDRYSFLEGRRGVQQRADRIEPPLVPDGTIYRALEKLANKKVASTGFLTYGRGFIVDTESANEMLGEDPMNEHVVIPIMSASDFTEDPLLRPSAYLINFGTRTEEDAATFNAPFN